jgi:fermentation-respiration switch protein FrsA (DUF1100 family)
MKNLIALVGLTSLCAAAMMAVEGDFRVPVLRVLRAVVIAFGLFFLFVACCQNRVIFPRTRGPVRTWDPGGGIEQVRFRTADGLTLHAWWHPGEDVPGEPGLDATRRPVVLWCHGNAGNITHREGNLRALAARGLAVFIFDYRGYGLSEGSPGEKGVYRDADAAYRYLVDETGIAPARIVVFGRSLGAAVALDLALREPVAGLVMESAFENTKAMAKLQMPLLPVGWLLRSKFDNLGRIGGLKVPLLMVHGDRDTLVPTAQGRAVFAAAPEPKRFYAIAGAGHNDTAEVGGKPYFDAFVRFCLECTGGAGLPG